MRIIGREKEKDILVRCLQIDRPQFVAVFGRMRTGKTYLIREYFHSKFAFYATGLSDQNMSGQLRTFHDRLLAAGDTDHRVPSDWFEAFSRLRNCLSLDTVYREPLSGKRVVFLDELPWMDTPRSEFRSALDYFWNSWGSAQTDLLLIVCGSATSWMMNHLLDDHGAFHNRITKRIQLMPFSLCECEKLLSGNGIILPKTEMIECYMAFGGIPYYLDRMDERLSLIQNMDELCFKPYGDLYNEYDNLIRSLFRKPEKHLAILETLSDTEKGLSRKSLSAIKAIGGGSVLTKDLQELEQNGFIHAYPLYPDRNEVLYQLADPFSLFALRALRKMEYASFSQFYRSPAYSVWRKNAFFRTCLQHVPQIKAALGISGVETHEAAWQCFEMGAMAQANLVIDRPDGIIHLCELKSTDEPFEMTREAYEQLQQRVSIFLQKVKPGKAVHVAIISANGLKPGKYVSIAQNLIDGDALFAR